MGQDAFWNGMHLGACEWGVDTLSAVGLSTHTLAISIVACTRFLSIMGSTFADLAVFHVWVTRTTVAAVKWCKMGETYQGCG